MSAKRKSTAKSSSAKRNAKKSGTKAKKPGESGKKSPARPKSSAFGNGFWRTHWKEGAILLALPFLLYFQAISFGYVLDDKIVLSENAYVQQGTEGIREIFRTESFTGFLGEQKNLVAGARYRPLSIATFAVEQEYFGEAPGINHGVNVLLYGLTALLIFRIFMVIAPGKTQTPWYFRLGFVAAVLFLLHPVHTEVVANIKGRDEILALLLSLATWYCVLRYFIAKQIGWLIAAPIIFLLAILAKENSLTFLAVIPLSVILFMRIPFPKLVLGSLPLLGASLVYLYIRFRAVGFLLDSGTPVTSIMNDPFLEASAGERYATITMTLGWYLKLLFVPHPLTHDYYPYHVPLVGWGDWRALLSLALVGGLLFLSYREWKRSRITAFSILFFFLTLSIVSNLLFSVGTFMNERFIYMPSVGFCLVFAYLVTRKVPKWIPGNAGSITAYAITGVFALGFIIKTIERVPAWENSATLEAAAIKVSYNSARANQYYAYSLYEKSLEAKDNPAKIALYDEAWPYVNKALEIYPQYSDAHTCRAGIAAGYYQTQAKLELMLNTFENTLKVKPVPFVDQFMNWLVGRQRHATEIAQWAHRVGFEWFWKQKNDAVQAKKYLNMGLRAAPGDPQLQSDLAQIG
ncbi:MAG: hypothetical protein AAF998_16235 [Bacteroidota bacterium]